MTETIRMTYTTQAVLKALLASDKELSGSQIQEVSDSWFLNSGTLYPILFRLERAGWLGSRWEEIDPKAEGRPRRRFYRLTEDGKKLAKEALAR